MRLCLLLLILSPVMLFGQVRRQAIVDSVKAAGTNLHGAFGSIGNSPGTRVERVQVLDSGEYVTLVVRVHVDEPMVVKELPLVAVGPMSAEAVSERMSVVSVPSLPIIRVIDSIVALPIAAVCELNIGGRSIAAMSKAGVPPMPNIPVEITAVPFSAVAQFSISLVAVRKLDMAIVPWLPHIVEEVDAIALLAVAPFRTGNVVPTNLAMAAVLDLPHIEDPLEELPYSDVIKLPITAVSVNNLVMVSVPPLEEEKMPVEEMHLPDEGYSLLEKLEGFSPELYSLKDGGFTIGFGFFVPYGEGSKWNKGVTWEEAERIIRQKVPAYEAQVKQYINIPLTQREFDALTMLAYNLGGFSRATSLVNDINGHADYETLQRDWMRFVHSKAPGVMAGLINRRKDELLVTNESNYQPERKIQVLKHRR